MRGKKVFVCKKCKNADCALRVLKKTDARLVTVGCQKICAGPVVGLKLHGRMEWFRRVDTPKALAGMRMLAERRTDSLVPALERRRLAKRSGRSLR